MSTFIVGISTDILTMLLLSGNRSLIGITRWNPTGKTHENPLENSCRSYPHAEWCFGRLGANSQRGASTSGYHALVQPLQCGQSRRCQSSSGADPDNGLSIVLRLSTQRMLGS